MINVCCEDCGTTLIVDDCINQDIYQENNSAYQFKVWHCPDCGAEYSGDIWYTLTVKETDIKKD